MYFVILEIVVSPVFLNDKRKLSHPGQATGSAESLPTAIQTGNCFPVGAKIFSRPSGGEIWATVPNSVIETNHGQSRMKYIRSEALFPENDASSL